MPARILFRAISVVLCMATLLPNLAPAQQFSSAAIKMFHGIRQQPNDLARYVYLVKTVQELPVEDRALGMQMFASVESELGLYNEALRDFPLKSRVAADISIPTATRWTAADAADVPVGRAAQPEEYPGAGERTGNSGARSPTPAAHAGRGA